MTRCARILVLLGWVASAAAAQDRPNILWITSEDNGPNLGCYGDTYATTPNLDALAARGVRYTRAWSNWPVCAPARTAIITGMYSSSAGAENMRSLTQLSAGMKFFPQLLREAGYYCTNNSKEDYNLADPGKAWDESSAKAHWKNRAPNQPFFAAFNSVVSHESFLRAKRPLVHDPTKAPVPPFHPDTPEVRADWARYYDNLTLMDQELGTRIKEIEDAGLMDSTIIFYFGDHGSGMPRYKRDAMNSGLSVPLIVYVPEKFRALAPAEYKPGAAIDRLVSFVDLAPTVLDLAGIQWPGYLQGHGFAGPRACPPMPYVFGARGRMDARIDLVRTVRDQRYVYVRNYMPHLPRGQHLAYQMETATTRVWYQMYRAGKLNAVQSYFWEPKAPEELYDLDADPYETVNLAAEPKAQAELQRLRTALDAHLLETSDAGFAPEPMLRALPAGVTPYDFAHDQNQYPLERVLETSRMAASLSADARPELVRRMDDPNAVIRYWAALGIYMRGHEAVTAALDPLRARMNDAEPTVRVVAAQALAQFGEAGDAKPALDQLMTLSDVRSNDVMLVCYALNAIDYLDERARPWLDQIKALPTGEANLPERYKTYLPKIIEKIVQDLESPAPER